MYNVILAVDEQMGIGNNNRLPWHIKEDMRYFRDMTLRSVIIMGRKTFESTGVLPKRFNIVISKTLELTDNASVCVVRDFTEAMKTAAKSHYTNIFVIGGGKLYTETIQYCDKLYITRISGRYDCDCYVDIDFQKFTKIAEENLCGTAVAQTWQRIPREEEQYINLVRKTLDFGIARDDRTGAGTISIFGCNMRFDLSKGFPLLTTKFVSFKNIFEELMWFLRGQCDVRLIEQKGINIWSAWKNSEGFAPKIYGHNWRHFGQCDSLPNGIDQIMRAIELIKTQPNSRRNIVCAWNPMEIDQCALPACHTLFQFTVTNGKLNCSLYQRSGDVALGIPYNIASYALLTTIVADHCNLLVGELFHTICDFHIYEKHIESLREQISRPLYDFPQIIISTKRDSIVDYVYSDFSLISYKHGKSIKFELYK